MSQVSGARLMKDGGQRVGGKKRARSIESDATHGTKRLHTAAKFSDTPSLEQFRARLEHFADERDWNQFHTPRNLVLALVGEVGELAEIFQWRGEVKPGLHGWSREEKDHVGEEISDCLMYLIRLADQCGLDLPQCTQRKFETNERKYPADRCKGSSKKYTAYTDD